MLRLPVMSPREFLKHLRDFGCSVVSVSGSHHKLYNPETGMRTTLAIHSGKDVTKAVFAGILVQLGIDVNEFLEFIKKN